MNNSEEKCTIVSGTKNLLRIAIIILLAVLIITALAISWVETYWYCVDIVYDNKVDGYGEYMETGAILVAIQDEYRSKFESGEMTIEDFGHNNFDELVAEGKYYYVTLKKHGERKVKEALVYCSRLDFIKAVYALPVMFFE